MAVVWGNIGVLKILEDAMVFPAFGGVLGVILEGLQDSPGVFRDSQVSLAT